MEGQPLSFSDFLERMKDPQAADLVRAIKSFIKQFEDRVKGHVVDAEADSERVQDFLARSEQVFRAHPVWRGSRPEVLDQAVEGLEKYVMSKIWRQTFAASQEDRERDDRYCRLSAALSFVDLPTLMGSELEPDEALMALARGELGKVDRYKAPRDKLLCLVNVKTMVENVVGAAVRAGANIGGADAFFPVFLHVIIHSHLSHLASNVEYCKRFRMRPRLCGQFDYMLANLESAALYLDTVDYEHLHISRDDFLARLSQAGLPEAEIALRHQQQEQQQLEQQQAAAAYQEAVQQQQQAVQQAAGAVQEDEEQLRLRAAPAADYGGNAGSEAAAMEPSAADAEAAVADLFEGLQLHEAGAEGSVPSTPAPAAAAAGPEPRQRPSPVQVAELPAGSTPGSSTLSPPGTAQSPPVLVQPGARGSPPWSAGSSALLPGAAEGQALMALPQGRQPQQEHWQQEQQQEGQWEQQAQPQWQGEEEPLYLQEMAAEGLRLVLAAEASGRLQPRYPYMYANAEDLSLGDVRAVLGAYKELALRYESLALALRQQLAGSGASGALESNGVDAAAAATQQQQQQQQQAGMLGARPWDASSAFVAGAAEPSPECGRQPLHVRQRSRSAPLDMGAVAAAVQEADAALSPGGSKWSAGGLLQRIASRGRSNGSLAHSISPPKGDSVGAAMSPGGTPLSPAARVAAAGKQVAQHPVFSSLFGSPVSKQQLLQQQVQQRAQHRRQHSAVVTLDAFPPAAAQEAAAGAAAAASSTAAAAAAGPLDELPASSAPEPLPAVLAQHGNASASGSAGLEGLAETVSAEASVAADPMPDPPESHAEAALQPRLLGAAVAEGDPLPAGPASAASQQAAEPESPPSEQPEEGAAAPEADLLGEPAAFVSTVAATPHESRQLERESLI